jgi:sulfofructose kinase
MPDFIACVGHASVDHHFEIEVFSREPTKTPAHHYRQIVGGMAANAAIGLARLGVAVRLIGRVGEDEAGQFIKHSLAQLGVQTMLETVPGGHTSVSSVIVDARGERQVFNHRGDALAKAHALNAQLLSGARAVLVDPRWGDGAAAALVWARENNILSVLDADVAPRDVLQRLVPLARWAVFSAPGLKCYAPNATDQTTALKAAIAAGASSAMVTLGEHGVAWIHAHSDAVLTQTSFPVEAVDTTGAGDVFHAALTFTLSELAPTHSAEQERQAISWACAAAAYKCTQRHGALGAPTRAQLDSFLETFRTTAYS